MSPETGRVFNLQVMLTKEVAEADGYSLKTAAPTGTSLLVEGELTKTPEGTEQVSSASTSSILGRSSP